MASDQVKELHVNLPVIKRDRTEMREPIVDDRQYVATQSGGYRPPSELTSLDPPQMRVVTIGMAINRALDVVSDKLSAEERRKRFTLSCRIEDAMAAGEPFLMADDDETRIKAALDLITGNHMLLARATEPVFAAERPKTTAVKPNGHIEPTIGPAHGNA